MSIHSASPELNPAASEQEGLVASQMLITQLADQEAVLRQQAQLLRTEAQELHHMADDEASAEASKMDTQAGHAEQVAKQIGDLVRELKLNPQKKLSALLVKDAMGAAARVMTVSDNALESAEEIKEESVHHQQEGHQKRAEAAQHEEPKAAKPACPAKEKKKEVAAEKPAAKPAKEKKKSESLVVRTKSNICHVRDEYVKPACRAVRDTVVSLHHDYLEPVIDYAMAAPGKVANFVIHSAPVVYVAKLGSSALDAVGACWSRSKDFVASILPFGDDVKPVAKASHPEVMGITSRTLTARAVVRTGAVGIPASVTHEDAPFSLGDLSPIAMGGNLYAQMRSFLQ